MYFNCKTLCKIITISNFKIFNKKLSKGITIGIILKLCIIILSIQHSIYCLISMKQLNISHYYNIEYWHQIYRIKWKLLFLAESANTKILQQRKHVQETNGYHNYQSTNTGTCSFFWRHKVKELTNMLLLTIIMINM